MKGAPDARTVAERLRANAPFIGGGYTTRLMLEAADELERSAPLPDGIHPCPTCDRQGCERCGLTGRGSYARVYADSTGDGRATLQLWFGAAATMELVATSDHSLAHDRVDSILATLAEAPGVVIRDRRGR